MNANRTDPTEEPPWLDPVSETALEAVIPHWMPASSAALYARWWQLEIWLRELAYVELRAKLGRQWTSAVKEANGRLRQDAPYTHMTGPDNDNPLAYLDYKQLLSLIEAHWPQFEDTLIERASWDGRQPELQRIRHRIGHLRKPHSDDLGRIEQTLRDLERGAFIAYASYNTSGVPSPDKHSDPVTRGWIKEEHPDAQRLISHADRQYETRVIVRVGRRPWARMPRDLDGASGVLWDVLFILRDRVVDVADLWRDSPLDSIRPYVVHMLADSPTAVRFTFSAVDDGSILADAIGAAFDAVLMTARRVDFESFSQDRWSRRANAVHYRVMHGAGWNIVDESTVPITQFGAGGGVEVAPNWR